MGSATSTAATEKGDGAVENTNDRARFTSSSRSSDEPATKAPAAPSDLPKVPTTAPAFDDSPSDASTPAPPAP